MKYALRSAGAIVPQPIAPRAEDPAAARKQCVAIIDRILHGLMTSA